MYGTFTVAMGGASSTMQNAGMTDAYGGTVSLCDTLKFT